MSTTAALDYSSADPTFTMGNRIAKRRRDLGLDQSRLASLVGVSRPLISKWERDVSIPDVVQALRLSQALDCSFGWLCGVDPRSRWFSGNRRSAMLIDLLAEVEEGAHELPGQGRMELVNC